MTSVGLSCARAGATSVFNASQSAIVVITRALRRTGRGLTDRLNPRVRLAFIFRPPQTGRTDYAQRRTCRRYCSYTSPNTSLSLRSSTGITTQFKYATTNGKSSSGQTCPSIPASPTYATLRPAYIGLRLNRYGPQVPSRDDACPGTVVVRARLNVSHPQPASAAPTMNSRPPTTLTAASALRAGCTSGNANSRPTPQRYARTNTHGTGRCCIKS